MKAIDHIKNFIIGLLFGICSTVPGFSLGTLAVSMNVFDRLIAIANKPREKLKEEWRFLLVFGLAMAIGLFAFAKLIQYLLDHHSVMTTSFFFGIVIGSIPMIAGKAVKPKFKPLTLVPFGICLGIMVLTVVLVPNKENVVNLAITPQNLLLFFVYGAVASACMIIPGISGTFVLMFLGAYASVIDMAADFNLILMLVFGVGVLVGFVGCAKIIDFLLKRWSNYTYGAILGFVLGSLLALWPKGYVFSQYGITPILVMVAGAVLTFLINLDYKAIKEKRKQRELQKAQ